MSSPLDNWPFDDWLRAGLRLGLSPAQVWELSLVDLKALASGSAPLSQAEMAQLCDLYPDGEDHG